MMLKLTLAACLLLALVEGSYYGYGGYGGYGYGSGYGYQSAGYGYGYPSYGYGYGYPSYGYGYGHGGSGYKSKRSVDHGEQVHVSGATGHTVVTPTHAYGGAPSYGSYATHSYTPHYPSYGYNYDSAYSYPSYGYNYNSAYSSPSHYPGYAS